jgi:hypothetical protein
MMSLDDWPKNATPEERAAFKLGRLQEQKKTRAQSRNQDKMLHATRSIAAYFPTHPAGSIAQKALDSLKYHIEVDDDNQ